MQAGTQRCVCCRRQCRRCCPRHMPWARFAAITPSDGSLGRRGVPRSEEEFLRCRLGEYRSYRKGSNVASSKNVAESEQTWHRVVSTAGMQTEWHSQVYLHIKEL